DGERADAARAVQELEAVATAAQAAGGGDQVLPEAEMTLVAVCAVLADGVVVAAEGQAGRERGCEVAAVAVRDATAEPVRGCARRRRAIRRKAVVHAADVEIRGVGSTRDRTEHVDLAQQAGIFQPGEHAERERRRLAAAAF